MKYTSLYHINNLLQNSPLTSKFYSKIEQLKQLKEEVASLLPPELATNCTVCNLKEGILVIVTKNPTWKHEINFIKMDLLEQLRKKPVWSGIKSISITIDYLSEELDKYNNQKVNLDKPSKVKKIKNKSYMISATTAFFINKMIDEDIKDPKLQQTMKSFIEKISS